MGNTCFGSSRHDDVTPLQHTPPPEPNSGPGTPRADVPRRSFFSSGGTSGEEQDGSSSRRSRHRPSSNPAIQHHESMQSAPEPPPPYFQEDNLGNPGPSSSRQRDNPAERVKKEQDQLVMAKRLSLLQHIPTDTYTPGEKRDKECIICMDKFDMGDKIRTLPCLHTYHLSCIDDWLLRSFTCATCMEPVDSALLSSYYAAEISSLADLGTSPAVSGSLRSSTDRKEGGEDKESKKDTHFEVAFDDEDD